MKPSHRYKADVFNVVDPDTFAVTIDLGFRITTYQRLRLIDVNTPEIRGEERPEGLEVKDYVNSLIENKEVTAETSKVGKYGRYICEVFLDDGSNLSEHLLAKNRAKPYGA